MADFKLSKAEIDRRQELVDQLTELRGKLEDAVSEFNSKVEELKAPVTSALEAYNEALGEARSFAEDIASEGDSARDQKSDKWQESERGEASRGWVEEWQNVSLDDIEIEFADDLPFDAPSHAEDLDGLPVELEV